MGKEFAIGFLVAMTVTAAAAAGFKIYRVDTYGSVPLASATTDVVGTSATQGQIATQSSGNNGAVSSVAPGPQSGQTLTSTQPQTQTSAPLPASTAAPTATPQTHYSVRGAGGDDGGGRGGYDE